MSQDKNHNLAIIGGGAAGFFAAANLAELCPDLQITIYEASKKFLAKVEISGGGRCNVTHSCFDIIKLSESYPRGQHELRGAFSRFSPEDTISWFEQRGVELKTEDDGRMFPVSDNSQNIIDCLIATAGSGQVDLQPGVAIKAVSKIGNGFKLELSDGQEKTVDLVMLATGSSKSGYGLAESLGHRITICSPSLFTFKSVDPRIVDLAGLSFKECNLSLKTNSNKEFKQTGPVLITHWGLSGPAILKLSAFAAQELAECKYQAKLKINWIAGTTFKQAQDHFVPLRKSHARKEIGSNPQFSLTRRFWEQLLGYCKIPFNRHFFELSNQEITRLCETLISSELTIEGKGEFKEEFVTCGGIDLKEINLKNFESRITPNLFFAGEILNIDGITGGFNFQAAWTGGWSVAQAIYQKLED